MRQACYHPGKRNTLDELRELARPGRCLIVYHHQTRRKGGHHGEIDYGADRLRERPHTLNVG